jgi:hypothetical protein
MKWLSRLFGKNPEVSVVWSQIGNVSKIPDCMGELEAHASQEGKLSRIVMIEDQRGVWGDELVKYERNYILKLTDSIKKLQTSGEWSNDCGQVRDAMRQGKLRVLIGTLPAGQRIAGICLKD